MRELELLQQIEEEEAAFKEKTGSNLTGINQLSEGLQADLNAKLPPEIVVGQGLRGVKTCLKAFQ